jgi:outer membrane lipoprotein
MKGSRYIFAALIAALIFLTACAPVFREEIMKNSTLNPSLIELNSAPGDFGGRLYLFGGKIVNLRTTKDGYVIEAMFMPVNSRGHIHHHDKYEGRFLAILPKEKGILDPLLFTSGKEVTIAGIYRGIRTQMQDKLEYGYSYFEIAAIRLWEERVYYYAPAYYYGPYPYPSTYIWYDPWWPHYHHRWR